jgi:hypothetical protein
MGITGLRVVWVDSKVLNNSVRIIFERKRGMSEVNENNIISLLSRFGEVKRIDLMKDCNG